MKARATSVTRRTLRMPASSAAGVRAIAFAVALALAGAAILGLWGCDKAAGPSASTSGGSAPDSEAEGAMPLEGYDAMPTDGPGESAAAAAVPEALAQAKGMREAAGQTWPDLTGIQPVFTAYLLAADLGGQATLFEVRADGIPHSLYAYQRAFDAASVVWTPSDVAVASRTAPQSDAESAAAAAVEAAMQDAFPEDEISVAIVGYRFVYLKDESPLLSLEIAADGSVISVGD